MNTNRFEIEDIGLLPMEKFHELPEEYRSIGQWWWLETAGEGTALIVAVCHDGSLSFPGCGASANYLRVRPLLRVRDAEKRLKPRDKVCLLGEDWIALSETELLHAGSIGTHNFNNYDDEKTSNRFEGSGIQKYLREWLEQKIAEDCEE